MPVLHETILDFDYSVSTEDRFAIRKFINNFSATVNGGTKSDLLKHIDESATAEGFSEFILQQPQIIDRFYKKFYGRRNNYVAMPKLKLTFDKVLFHLAGLYEEYQEGILSTAGDIELSLIKKDDNFKMINLKFYPRMRVAEQYE